jgi:hypothetical protein
MKKILILSLFLCLLLGTALYAQTMITIGDGTTTNTTTGHPTPYGTYWKNFRQQYLYTAADIEAAGGGAGPINSLAFNVANVNTCSPMPNFTIRIKETSQTALTTTFEAGTYTQVFYENDFLPVAGWNTHTFDAPYTWDGTSNLLVDIVTTFIPGSYTQNASVYYTATTGTNTALRYQSDSVDASTAIEGSFGGLTVNRANLMFNMTAVTITDPPSPAAIGSPADAATGIALSQTLNWSPGSGLPTGYKLYFGDTNPPAYIGDLGDVLTYNPGTLSYSRTYYWQVIPYNAEGDATGCPVWSFSTMTDPTVSVFPWLENFDTITVPNLPHGWVAIDNNGDGDSWVTAAVNPNSAPNAARIYTDYNAANDDYLVTPPIVLTGNQELKFWTRAHSASEPDEISILLSTTTPTAGAFTEVLLPSTAVGNTTYTEYTVDLSAYSGTVYISFTRRDAPADGWYLYLDDVMVRDIPDSPIISVSPDAWDFGTKLINTTSPKEFTITNVGVGSLNVSSINVTGTGFALAEAFSPVSLLTSESASFTVNFAPTTASTYSGNIAINDNRAVTNIPLSGVALDATIYSGDLPYLQNFDGLTVPALPIGWAKVPGTTGTVNTQASNAASSPNSLYMYSSGATSIAMISLAPVSLTSTHLRLKFSGRSNFTAGGVVDIGYMTDINDPLTFTLIGSRTLSTLTYQTYSVDLGTVNGIMNYAIRASHTPPYSILLDDIIFEVPAPIAPEPASVAWPLNGMTTFVNPLLKWTPSATGEPALSYKVYLNQSGTFTEGDLVYEGTALQYQTEGLSFGRTYYWKVLPTNAFGSDPTCPTWSFDTPGESQLAESFDATAFPPAGWANGTTGNWARSTATPLFHGTGHAYKFSSTSVLYQLSTPMVTINNGDILDFWTRATNTSQILQIAYSVDRTTWTQLGANITYAATGIWYNHSIDLSSLAGDNYYLAFQTGNPTSTGSIYVDHVIGPDITPLTPGMPALTAPADAAINQSRYPNLTWTAPTTGGIPTGYNVYLDTADGSTLFAGNVTSPYTVTTALDWDETYFWTVKAFNAAGTGDAPAARSFTVMSDPTIYAADLPYFVDFGTTSSDPFPPANWTRFGGLLASPTVPSGTGSWIQDDWLNITTTPNKAARINIYSTLNGWLLTPPIEIPGTGYELKFDLGLTAWGNSNPAATSGVDDVFAVLIGDGSSWTPANVMRQWDNQGSPYVYNEIPNTGMTVTLPIPSAGEWYIAFYGASTVSNADNDLFVDNVLIRETPVGAPDPVTLVSPADEAIGLPVNGFNLTWADAITGGTPTEYAVFMGSTEDVADYAWYNITGNSFNPTQDELDPITFNYSETWYWTVQAINGEGDADVPTPYSFTIMDDPRILSLPYGQNFDGVPSSSMPEAWTGYVNAANTFSYVYTSTSYSVSAPNSMAMYNSSDTAADLRLITPDILVPMNSIKLSFSARAGSVGPNLLIGTVDALDGTGTFNQMASIPLTATHTIYSVSFASYVGADNNICFKFGGTNTYQYIYIDNVYMEELVDTDMGVVSLTGVPYGFQNTAVTHTVSVKNNGTEPVSNYTVYLKSVGTRAILGQETFTDPLAADATHAVEFTWTPTMLGSMDIYGEVFVADDAVAENNVSDIMTFDVLQEGSLIESFEGGVIPANWTVLNADGGTQVWQATTVNPRTGTYAVRVRWETTTLDNDDWLITPPLQVTSSTTDNISFWMRTYDGINADPWQVLISTTDTNPASFTMIDEGDGYMGNYVQKSYNLDSYGNAVIYLAVRYMGAYDWYLYVDDFVGPPIFSPSTLATPEVAISTVGANVVLNWAEIPYATSYEVMAADAPEGPYTLAATVTAPTYSTASATKKFFKVIAKAGAARSITAQPLSLEQQLLQDEMERVKRSRQ